MRSNKLKPVSALGFLLWAITTPLLGEENGDLHSAEKKRTYTLQQAIDHAMAHNPNRRIIQHQMESADGLIKQSQLLPNPSVTLKQEDFAGNSTELTQQAIIFTQPIELFGQRQTRIATAVTKQQGTNIDTSLSKTELLNKVVAEFYRVLGSYEEHALTQESIRVSQEITDIVAGKSAAGKVSPVELNRANILLSNAKLSAARAELDHHETERRLAILLGLEEDTPFTVQGNLREIADIPAFDKLLERLRHSPRLKQQKNHIDVQKALLAEKKSQAWPDFSFYFGVNRFEQTDEYAYQAGLNIGIPLFDRNQGNIQSANSQVSQAKAELDAKWLTSSHQLRDAYETMKTTYEHVVILQNEIVPGSRQVLDTLRSAYESGKLSLYEVLDAQQNWLESKGHYIDALIDYHVATTKVGDILGESVFYNALTEVTP